MSIINNMWVEKYRPNKIEDLVLPEDYMFDFRKYIIKDKEIPHLLFYGSPGGGKTALCRILASPNGVIKHPDDNVLQINGSAKETRGITFVQDVIEPYLKLPPNGDDNIKIVFIDEADHLTDASFSSLRGIVEKYAAHARFMCTCNYFTKIPAALQSRFRCYKFKQLPIDFVVSHCENILNKENIKFDVKDIKFLVEALYPDIRKVIDTLQRCSMTGKLKVSKDDVITNEKTIIASVIEICNYVKNANKKKLTNLISIIVKLVNSPDLEFRNLYSKLFFTEDIPVPAKIIVNKYCNTHKDCLVPSMNFMAMLFEIIQALQKYYKVISK